MATKQGETVRCEICGQPKQRAEVLPAEMVRAAIGDTIRKSHPDWGPGKYVCFPDLNRLRADYVEEVLRDEVGQLSDLEEQVVRSLEEQELLSRNVNTEFDRELTLGERVADRVADFGGSWTFITIFGGVLVLWMIVNSLVLYRAFDPYPFILLNLVLSCLAAIQAPIIMMSQNRQESRDRMRAEEDYRVNLKAELEVRHVNAKIDLLLTHQWRRLMEIQQIQMDLMEELTERGSRKKGG
jgi:uncharacterized membrane protein